MPAQAGADVTANNTAKDTAAVNGVASHLISPISGLMPAQAGADVTAQNQSATTASISNHTQDNLPDGTTRFAANEVKADSTTNHHAVTPGSFPSSGTSAHGPTTGTTLASIVVDSSGPSDVFVVSAVIACAYDSSTSGTPTTYATLTVDGGSTNYGSASSVYGVPAVLPFMGSVTGLSAGSHTLAIIAYTDAVYHQTQFNANESFVMVQHIVGSEGGINTAPSGGNKITPPTVS
jgi:hypothetical protein